MPSQHRARSRSFRARFGASFTGPTLALTLAAATALTVPAASADTSTATASASAFLAIDLPSTAALRASPKKVFAHYLPTFNISLDNVAPTSDYYARNYLSPSGENGIHAAYGGFLRDRPLPRAPLADADWKLRDMEQEVRQAVAAGLDGFSVDILTSGGDRTATNIALLLQAAHNVDPSFHIMLMPDMTGSLGTLDPAALARVVADLAASPAAYRLDDGRLVVAPFRAELHDVTWWTQFLTIMATTYNLPVAFNPLFLDEQPYETAFAPISYGMANWGGRNPAWNPTDTTYATHPMGRVARVHGLAKSWMQPVSVQDERPRSGIAQEAQNTDNLRATWRIAIDSNSEWVQLTTWDDYAEGSAFAPSDKHGWSFLDINAYYLAWFKSGSAPVIARDTVYLTHRTHAAAAAAAYPETTLMGNAGGSPFRDRIEALSFLTMPATVTVTVGSTATTCAAPAGVSTCLAPLGLGAVSTSVTRNGMVSTTVTSPYPVVATPYVQDLQYVAVSSRRQGTSAVVEPAPDIVPPSAPTAVATTVSGSTVSLTWSPSTDVSGVTSYAVFRSSTADGAPVATTRIGSAAVPALNTTAPVGTSYYKVVAYDPTGNASSPSASTSATVRDTTVPTQPSARAQVTGSTVIVSWPPATDDVGVAGYEITRTTIGTAGKTRLASTTSLTDTAVPAGTSDYAVVALDAAGNRSTAAHVSAVVSAPVIATVRPTEDSYANQGAPGTNFGADASLSARGSVGATSYLRFSVPNLPAGRTLTGAVLTVRTNTLSFAGSKDAFPITLVSGPWIESTLTWNNRAPLGASVGTLTGATGVDQSYAVTLSATDLRAFAGKTVTLALSSAGKDNLWLWSSNFPTASYRPALALTYS